MKEPRKDPLESQGSEPRRALGVRSSGVLLHVTSLPGPSGSGDVEREATRFVDFLAAAEQRWWQMLLVGPSGYGDSPDSAMSAFAGSPLLIDLEALARGGLLTALRTLFEDQCPKLLDGVAPAAPSAAAKPRAAPETKAALPVTKLSAVKSPAPKARTRSLELEGSPMYTLPPSWRGALADEIEKPYFQELARFVAEERKTQQVFPPDDEVFSALSLTPHDDVRVLILGQDPYHDDDQAHGLCFSVRPGIRPPPSLVNIYKELESDVGVKAPKNGNLIPWAKQGVLLLNAVLTVRAHTPNSHKDRGWETFTDAVIRKVNEKKQRVVFLLWGAYAQKKAKLIDDKRHTVIKAVHPSPLSARNGFFGSKPFSTINHELEASGSKPVDWRLPAR